MANALRPLLSPAARGYFDPSAGSRFLPGDVLAGRIMVASINAVLHPQLASLLFRNLKRDFYSAVQSRAGAGPEDRLCLLIVDEFPLAASSQDVEALATIRSKGAGVVAAAVGSFDPDWRRDLEGFLVDEYKDAVNGIVDLRNNIAHGRYVGITMTRVQDYYVRIKAVVERVAAL
jgi:hypothetical protein